MKLTSKNIPSLWHLRDKVEVDIAAVAQLYLDYSAVIWLRLLMSTH